MNKLVHLKHIVLFAALFFSACEDSALISETEEEKNRSAEKETFVGTPFAGTAIEGKWKLIEINHPVPYKVYDYTADNIVYEFKANGALEVKSNGKQNLGFQDGIYRFNFESATSSQNTITTIYQTKLGGLPWYTKFTDTGMTISRIEVDGSAQRFKRLY